MDMDLMCCWMEGMVLEPQSDNRPEETDSGSRSEYAQQVVDWLEDLVDEEDSEEEDEFFCQATKYIMDDSGNLTFPSAKTQDLLLLARKTQSGDVETVRQMIEKNPRVLCTSSDSPTILQEGARYNVLHIAARWGKADLVDLILSTVSNYDFINRLYPNEDIQINRIRTRYLTDLYLNTPDKGALETPLHFACKFCCDDVVEILIKHPLCHLGLKNMDNKLAREIIGTRSMDKKSCRRIKELFLHDKIVPIWRDPDCGVPAVVGRPVNPRHLGVFTPFPFHERMRGIDLNWFGPIDADAIPQPSSGIQREIRAFVGPMEERVAQEFYERITHSGKYSGASMMNASLTSPRSLLLSPSPQSPGLAPDFQSPKKQRNDQSLLGSPICASTPTRQPYRGTEGASISFPGISEMLTPNRSQLCPQIAMDKTICRSDPEKGLELVARNYAWALNVPCYEYWKFSNKFLDFKMPGHINYLETFLWNKEWEMRAGVMEANRESDSEVSSVCEALRNFHLNDDSASASDSEKKEKCVDVEMKSTEDRKSSSHDNKATNPDPVENPFKVRIETQLVDGSYKTEATCSSSDQCNKREQVDFIIQKQFDETKTDYRGRSYLLDSWDDDSTVSIESMSYEEFYSAHSSPLSEYGDCFTFQVFLGGAAPSKEDYQLVHLLETVNDDLVDPTLYPATSRWYNSLSALGTSDQKRRKVRRPTGSGDW